MQDIINTYLGHVNSVSGETFEMELASIGYDGMHTFDTDDFTIGDDVLGTTEWVLWGNTNRIARFVVHMKSDADWAVWSQPSVLTHEIGHGFGLWHAYGITDCNTCGWELMPTMIACDGQGSELPDCGGCGNWASEPYGRTLSNTDIFELKVRYIDAVFTDPVEEEPQKEIPGARSASLSGSPNPFNPIIRIDYLADKVLTGVENSPYHMAISDMRGRTVLVAEGRLSGYAMSYEWNDRNMAGRALPAGVYHVLVVVNGLATSSKITLLK